MDTICTVMNVDGFGKKDVFIFFRHVQSYLQSSENRSILDCECIRGQSGLPEQYCVEIDKTGLGGCFVSPREMARTLKGRKDVHKAGMIRYGGHLQDKAGLRRWYKMPRDAPDVSAGWERDG